MKKLILTIALSVCTIPILIGQTEAPLSKNEKAIKEVIESESEYFWGRDYDKWQNLYVHGPYVVWTASTKDGVTRYHGWDSWSQRVRELFESDPEPMEYEGVVYKYNYQFRIYKNGAWVSFEQMNDGTKTWETRIMEKHKGDWKIAMVQVIYNANENLDVAFDNDEE